MGAAGATITSDSEALLKFLFLFLALGCSVAVVDVLPSMSHSMLLVAHRV